MDFTFRQNITFTDEDKKFFKQMEEQAANLSKIYGGYLIKLTELCFDQCINTNSNIFSNSESLCVKNCTYNFTKINEYMINRLNKRDFYNKNYIESRANDYFDIEDFKQLIHPLTKRIKIKQV